MGRIEKSQGLAPPAVRKDIRAKQARHIINKVIPSLLTSNARARKGAEGSELIVDPGPINSSTAATGSATKATEDDEAQYIKRKGQGRRKLKGPPTDEKQGRPKGSNSKSSKARQDSLSEDLSTLSPSLSSTPRTTPPKPLTIRILTTDTLTAAHMLTFPSKYPQPSTPSRPPLQSKSKKTPFKTKICTKQYTRKSRDLYNVHCYNLTQTDFSQKRCWRKARAIRFVCMLDNF